MPPFAIIWWLRKNYNTLKTYWSAEAETRSVTSGKTDQLLAECVVRWAGICKSQQDSKKIKKIDEGYQKIYQTYIKETDAEYRKDYNAKGYSYIVTYEDETQIRYLMYDRDNQEGTKTQYVYYKNIKSTDGSWSMMDAEILDMYQYDYESKEVKDLQKTSW